MTPEHVRFLYAYDAWANKRILDACAKLDAEQFTRNLGSSFPSVRDTLAHIMGAQWLWMERFHGRSARLPQADGFADLNALRARWEEVERDVRSYVNSLSAADLQRSFDYHDLKGIARKNTVWEALQQVANHGTYHRGQVTTMLRQLGATPVGTDMLGYFREQQAAASQAAS